MSDIFTTSAGAASDGSYAFTDKATGTVVFSIGTKGNVQYKKVTLTSAQILAMGGSPLAPVTILAAPGAGLSYYVKAAVLYLNYGTTTYAAGNTMIFKQGTSTLFTTSSTLIQNTSSIIIQPALPGVGTTASLGAANTAITATCDTAFTTGNGTLDVHIWYALLAT